MTREINELVQDINARLKRTGSRLILADGAMPGKVGLKFHSHIWPNGFLIEDFGPADSEGIENYLLGFNEAVTLLPIKETRDGR